MRPLYEIAEEIEREVSGKPFWVYADAYVTPMKSLENLSDMYGLDSAEYIVNYALANLGGWRGEVARRVKAELNAMLKEHRKVSA